jgi:S-adenosylmethionine:tRNA ribosyltransferase-isomerase
MKTSELDYNLPDALIATEPAEPRDSARLLLLDKVTGATEDRVFSDLSDILGENDVLVLNNSKVIPARLFGNVLGNIRGHEVLLVKHYKEATWECWVRNGKKLAVGETLIFSNKLSAIYVERKEDIFYLKFSVSGPALYAALHDIGEMPIPPYILKARGEKHDNPTDNEEYQTVFAKSEGSVAAPTAGLHFTDELLSRLSKKGVQIEYVTLHVSLGTFQPLTTENIEDFQIHSEYYEIDPDTAVRLNQAKSVGKRIIATGTTAVRVLESAAEKFDACGLQNPGGIEYTLLPKSGETSIYIFPGYEYRFVDAMITNFHLPKSSLLLLVSAFAGTENIRTAYAHAIEEKYRFYSYGDAMFIS